MSARRAVRGRRGLIVVVVVALGAAGLAFAAHAARDRDATSPVLAAPRLPDPPQPAFAIGRPVALGRDRDAVGWAPVLETVQVRAAPEAQASVVARVDSLTPEGTANIVPVLDRAPAADGSLWVRVRVPALPDNATGWVPRTAIGGYTIVRTRLVVDLERLEAVLYEDGRPDFRAPVGVGTEAAPTPRGEFYVRNVLRGYRSAFYGPVAFGTSARSRVLTDWPAGGFVGIHGTDRPDLLPGRVSHGCIRLKNRDILRLARLMPIGTALTIR